MLHLIERALPAPIHRLALKIAYRLRHRWRSWRKNPIEGVNVIITDFDGSILLLRHSYGRPDWSLPGGGVRTGCDAEVEARREIMEELGIKLGKLSRVGVFHSEISSSPHIGHLYAGVVDQSPRPDRREVLEARFFPPHSLPEPMGEMTRKFLAEWRASRIAG